MHPPAGPCMQGPEGVAHVRSPIRRMRLMTSSDCQFDETVRTVHLDGASLSVESASFRPFAHLAIPNVALYRLIMGES